jgi:hypothetical protein
MQHHIQTLVKHFFHKESLQEVTVNQLQKFIDDYPYSAVGQLLLAKKLRDTGAQNFDEQGGKATLYFHDPVWAGWLLKQDMTTDRSVFEQPAPVNETPHFVFNNIPASEPVEATADTPPWEEPAATEPVAEQQPVVLEQPGAVNEFEPLREEPVIDQTAAGEENPVAEETRHEAPPAPETQNPEIADSVSPSALAVAQGLPQAQPQSEGETDLGFEPYHTIDYFASLGIKLKPEELAKDKLGQQLKSFTDWLRSMKKIGPAQAPENVNELDDLTNKSIQKIAEFSNEAKEIITEAMAEVWAKQGHREKAVEIYEKLSLLNPSKSSYFAARIDALKS